MKTLFLVILLSITFTCFSQGLPKNALKVISNKNQTFKQDSVLLFNNDDTLNVKKRGIPYNNSEAKYNNKLQDWFEVKNFSIYGGGALQSLLSAKKNDSINELTSTTGSIAFGLTTRKISCEILYSFNGKEVIQMTSLGQFGSSLMNPNLSGQSFSISVVSNLINYVGLYGSFQVADNLWQTDSTTSISAAPMIARLGICWNPFDFGEENDNIRFILTAGYVHRSIKGDFNNKDQIISGITIHPRGYNGFDFAANLYLRDLRFIFQYSQNIDSKISGNNADLIVIPGYSGGQVSFAIVVTGNIIHMVRD